MHIINITGQVCGRAMRSIKIYYSAVFVLDIVFTEYTIIFISKSMTKGFISNLFLLISFQMKFTFT